MSIFDTIGQALGGATGVGGLLGAGLGFLGSRSNASNALQAAETQAQALRQNAKDAIAAGQPFGMGSLGGTVDYDMDSRTGLLNLSPQLSNIYQGALDRSGLFGGQAMQYAGLDPFEAGDLFYQQEQPLVDKERNLRRTDLETRLLAQGRLGGSGGALEREALETAFETADMGRRQQAFSRAQDLISGLLGREKGDLATATGLLDVPIQMANIGRGIGGSLGNIAASGLASQQAGEALLANSRAAAGTPLGSFGNAVSGLFRPQKPATVIQVKSA